MAISFSIGDMVFGSASGFLLGVLAASVEWSLFFVLVTVSLCVAIFCIWAKTLYLKETAMIFAAIWFGAFYYHFYIHKKEAAVTLPFGRSVIFAGVVSDEPQPSDKYQIITLKTVEPRSGEIKVFAPPQSSYRYGDLLRVEGILQTSIVEGGDPAVFSPKIKVIARHQTFWIREKLISIKEAILTKFGDFLPDEQAALLGGIAFGSKQNFTQELKNAMSLSGTTHLVAVSGYNITIVALAAGRIFETFLSKRKTFVLVVLSIILFVLMAGIQASAVRAAIMGFFALLAAELGRAFNVRNAIVITAVLMVLWNPTVLVSDAGFALSFLSLTGIVVLEAPLKKLFRYKDPGLLDWKANGLTTLSAQLGVLPVLLGVFGNVSALAVIANILVLGTVPLTMFLGGLLAVMSFVSSYGAFFVAQYVGFLLSYQLAVIRFFGSVVTVPLPAIFNSSLAFIAYYAALGIFAFTFSDGK